MVPLPAGWPKSEGPRSVGRSQRWNGRTSLLAGRRSDRDQQGRSLSGEDREGDRARKASVYSSWFPPGDKGAGGPPTPGQPNRPIFLFEIYMYRRWRNFSGGGTSARLDVADRSNGRRSNATTHPLRPRARSPCARASRSADRAGGGGPTGDGATGLALDVHPKHVSLG